MNTRGGGGNVDREESNAKDGDVRCDFRGLSSGRGSVTV